MKEKILDDWWLYAGWSVTKGWNNNTKIMIDTYNELVDEVTLKNV